MPTTQPVARQARDRREQARQRGGSQPSRRCCRHKRTGTRWARPPARSWRSRPSLFKAPPYDPLRDFIPISVYLKSPFILVVDPALPVRSVPELIAYIKERPGKISFSSSSVGGAPHLAAEHMKAALRSRHQSRALSQQPAIDCRHRGRTRLDGLCRSGCLAAADPGRQAARHCGEFADTPAVAAGCADVFFFFCGSLRCRRISRWCRGMC